MATCLRRIRRRKSIVIAGLKGITWIIHDMTYDCRVAKSLDFSACPLPNTEVHLIFLFHPCIIGVLLLIGSDALPTCLAGAAWSCLA